MREYSIAAIPADGIGPEVISAGTTVLEALQKRVGDIRLNVETFDWGSDFYRRHGVMMPADGLDRLKAFDAIYFGAVGAPDVPDHVTLWGLRLPICQGFDQYANVRPTRILPGITPPLRNCGAGRPRLGHRARKLGGRVFRQRRSRPQGPAGGGRDRGRRSSPASA